MDDIYGDRGSCRVYPPIESLKTLYWKKRPFKPINSTFQQLSQQDEDKDENIVQQIEMIKKLTQINSVQIIKIQSFGKYIEVELESINNKLIERYKDYILFKQHNYDEINKIYYYLEEKVPIDFIASNLYYKK